MAHSETLIFLALDGSEVCTLTIYSPAKWQDANGLQAMECVPPAQALDAGEAAVQLLEGVRYEYELSNPAYQLALAQQYSDSQGVVLPSSLKGRMHCGVVNPGLFTGQLPLAVQADGVVVGRASVEVRSRKLSYKADYQHMLKDITKRCIDLLQEMRSPSAFNVEPDPGNDPETIGQRFAFVRALLQNRAFENALHRITTHPQQMWQHGGDKVYGAGQRGVATLYEYWVFFDLLYIVAEGLHSLVIWSMTLCRTWNFLSTRATTLCCRANRQVLRLGTRLRHL